MRRGFSLVEILVAMAIMVSVSAGALLVFRYQSRNAAVQRDVAEMNLMAKGLAAELSRTIRMAGGALPPENGGLEVRSGATGRLAVALNRGNGVDTTRCASYFHPGNLSTSWGVFASPLVVPVKHAVGVFPDSGYLLTTVRVPPVSYASGTKPSPKTDTMVAMRILKVVPSGSLGGLDTGAMVVVDGSWFASLWNWDNSVVVSASTYAYAMDTVRYWKSGDTVFRRIDRGSSTAFAVGVDSLRFWYMNPTGGWLDSIYAADTSREIDKVRVRLRVRTRHVDPLLAGTNPASKGYHYQTIETEVSLRNSATLSNR